MFNKNFYPTPSHVLDLMNIDCMNKTVLEPQAGKGDIVDYLKLNGAKKVIACEINKDLQKIVQSKCQLVGDDFFTITKGDVSHVQMIVMNPPFDNADKHILHAFEIAPEGCEIISLCNWQTISKKYLYTKLEYLIRDANGITQNLGDCFSDSERKTNVEVGLITLFKPIISADAEFEGFFTDKEPEYEGSEGLLPYNEVRNVVQRYVGTIKEFDKLEKSRAQINYLTKDILGVSKLGLSLGYNDMISSKEDFIKRFKVRCWNYVIDKSGIRKFTTSGMNSDINKFVETQCKYPFTMRNIYRMFDLIMQTRGQQFDKALIDVIDDFTRYTKENRFEVEGWVANNGHMLSKKIVIPYFFKRGWNNADYIELDNRVRTDKLNDLVKIICLMNGSNYEEISTLSEFAHRLSGGRLETGRWYSWGFFEFKGFYKGTIHLKFQNEKDWYLVNQAYGKLKGFVLPEKYNKG